MGLSRTELDDMRALIRARSGLPAPPIRPTLAQCADALSSDTVEPTEGPSGEQEDAESPRPGAPSTPSSLEPVAEPENLGEGWRPDAAVHRLVELLMEMRALSSGGPSRSVTLADRDVRAA